jgi:disulfide bond formation protein DsbB
MMGKTMSAEPETPSGEARLKAYHRRYTGIIVRLMIAGGLIGGVVGAVTAAGEGTTLPQAAAIIGVALFVIAAGLGSYHYFRAVDELELEANKWAGLAGINAYLLLYVGWRFLAWSGVTANANGDVIFGITMLVACAAFLYRRFR